MRSRNSAAIAMYLGVAEEPFRGAGGMPAEYPPMPTTWSRPSLCKHFVIALDVGPRHTHTRFNHMVYTTGGTMMSPQPPGSDAADLEKFGYTQALERRTGKFASFAVAFAFVSIATGIF